MNSHGKTIIAIIASFIFGILSHMIYLNLNDSISSKILKETIAEEPVADLENLVNAKFQSKDKNELLQELKIVKKELESLRLIRGSTEVPLLEKQRKQFEVVEKTMELFNSAEFNRDEAVMGIETATEELRFALDLTEEQSKYLKELLESDLETDLEFKQFLYTRNDLSEDAREARMVELRAKLAANQERFEEQLSEQLSEQQMAEYLEFENKKVRLEHEKFSALRSTMTQGYISDLNEFQSSQINRYFEGLVLDTSELNLGSYGTPLANIIGTKVIEGNDDLSLYLERILTKEQFDEYRNRLSN
jgi:hypothetical protein